MIPTPDPIRYQYKTEHKPRAEGNYQLSTLNFQLKDMSVYRIAEINILINPIYDYTAKLIKPYITDSSDYEFDASASKEEIKAQMDKEQNPVSPALYEGSVILTKICKRVL